MDASALAQVLERYFSINEYETQTLPQGNSCTVQGRKLGPWREAFDMNLQASIVIEPVSFGLKISIGGAAWFDRLLRTAINITNRYTAPIGVLQQKRLLDDLWREVEHTIRDRGCKRIS